MASNDYYSKTKPNGMPDYIWEAQQAAQRAEAAKKNVGNKPNTTNTASSKKAEGAAPVKGTTTVTHSSGSARIPNNDGGVLSNIVGSLFDAATGVLGTSTDELKDAGKTAINAIANTTGKIKDTLTSGLSDALGVVGNAGHEVGETAKEAISNTVNKALNNLSNSSGNGNGGGTGGNGGLQGVVVNPGANASIGAPIIPTDTSTTPSGGYPTGGSGGGSTPSAPSGGYYNGANWSGGMSYKPYPTAEDMAGYVSTILNAAKTGLGDAIKPDDYLVEANKPGKVLLRPLEELAETFGIEYDYDKLYGIFNDSVEKKYDAIYERQKQNEDKYYDNAIAAQNTLIDTLARDRGTAVQAGVSKGMQAANALASMLGVSQQFASNATALSQERGQTAKEYGSDLAQAVVDAEATSNERKNAIMEISKMLYGYDSEQYVADMDNYNTILTNNAALQQSYMNNHTALQNALASIFGSVAANKITGDANVQSSTLAAEAQKYAAKLAAEAQMQAAAQNLAAQQAAAQASKEAQQIYADAMRDSALIGSGTYSGLLSNGLPFTGALAGNEIGAGQVGSTSTSTSNKTPSALLTGLLPALYTYYLSPDIKSSVKNDVSGIVSNVNNAISNKTNNTASNAQDAYRGLLDALGIKYK